MVRAATLVHSPGLIVLPLGFVSRWWTTNEESRKVTHERNARMPPTLTHRQSTYSGFREWMGSVKSRCAITTRRPGILTLRGVLGAGSSSVPSRQLTEAQEDDAHNDCTFKWKPRKQ